MIDIELIWFSAFGVLTIISAINVVISRNVIHSALSLGFMMLCVALLYISLNAEFIAMVQILVYIGAVIVLILFVIMLTGGIEKTVMKSILIPLIPSLLFIILIINSINVGWYKPVVWKYNVKDIGNLILNEYVFPFEVISLILLVAMVGTIFITKYKEKEK
ncbi:MAG: hypothetical protein DRO92_03470 [Candidatus Altiarchaeales archaeon]|nr:MAG: hypothetical protein DRO92_03470 [Candidatus Altiarchaeales archaeon]